MDMCAKAEQADPPERTLLKDCGEFRTNWDGIVSNWTQLARGHVEAKQLWNTLDGKLRELSDAVSTHEAEWIYRSMSHINEEVSRIKERAKEDIERDKRNAEKEMKDAISSVALEAAKKLVSKEMDEETQKKYIDDFIDKAGNSKW